MFKLKFISVCYSGVTGCFLCPTFINKEKQDLNCTTQDFTYSKVVRSRTLAHSARLTHTSTRERRICCDTNAEKSQIIKRGHFLFRIFLFWVSGLSHITVRRKRVTACDGVTMWRVKATTLWYLFFLQLWNRRGLEADMKNNKHCCVLWFVPASLLSKGEKLNCWQSGI